MEVKVQDDPLLPNNGISLAAAENDSDLPPVVNAKSALLFGVLDSPPWATKFFMGFQQVMVAVGGAIVVPIMVADLICAEADESAKLKFIGTTLVMTGVATIMQTALGCRLPLLQGPSFGFIPPILAMMKLEEMRCPATLGMLNATIEEGREPWRERMQIVQGGLIGASLVQILLGLTGLVGVLVRYVGPLTIAPLMLLIEISVAKEVLRQMESHWISLVALFSLVLFLLYLPAVQVPFPYFDVKKRKFAMTRAPLFGLFPFLISIGLVWLLAVLFTVTFFTESDLMARTDTKSSVIAEAPWLRVPYPGQWGVPIFNWGVFFGMLGGTIASVVESVGDYQACARVCGERRPPSHAVNRGIFIEGVACFITGFFGGTVSLTTFSQNIGVIGSTRVASRSMMVIAGVMFVFLGFFTKFASVLVTLPMPVIGSILGVSLSIVGGVGLSSIKLIDASSSRNIAILGLSIMSGMVIPMYIAQHPVATGSVAIDQIIQIILSIEMLVGGIVGFILDNTVPGTRAERGLATEEGNDLSKTDPVYGFSDGIMSRVRQCPLFRYLPIMPK